MITNTFWTFCMPQFLLCFYLRREAKAGFDKQVWLLCLRFISTGGTLWDKNSVSQKVEPGSQPKGKQMPWEPTRCHHWQVSDTGNKNAHSRPCSVTESSPSPAHMWGFVHARQERWKRLRWWASRKWFKEQWIKGQWKDPPRRAQITALWKPQPDWLFRSPQKPQKPSSLHPLAHNYLGPLCHTWGHLPAAHRAETLTCAGSADPAMWSGDSTNYTVEHHP